MPLQKLQFRPGVNRESTTLANEGGWFESNKIRFRSGYPEKIGGWTKDLGPLNETLAPSTGTFWGVCRSMWNWITLSGYNLLSLGTNLKYYIQNGPGGNFYDVTPITGIPPAATVVASNAFTTTASSSGTNRYVTVTCNVTGYNGQTGDFVTISSVSGAINGIPVANLQAEFQITYVSSSSFTIQVYVDSTITVSAGGPTGAATFAFQISTGGDVYTIGTGWGAGGWGGSSGPLYTTTLNGALTAPNNSILSTALSATDTTINVASAATFSNTGSVLIDSEIIAYTTKTATTLSGLTRLSPVAHVASIGVIQYATSTITVASSSAFPSSGVFAVGGEIISYASKGSATTFDGCVRGYNGYVTAHASGAAVAQYATTGANAATGWGSAATSGIGIQLRTWSQSNYGQNLVFNPRGGGIYYWVVDSNPTIFNRAQVVNAGNTNTQNSIAYWDADATCPTVCNFVLVSDASRFTIAFGTNDPTGVYATTVLDPMQIRWSDQENLLVWTPAITNQAGDYRLSHGSAIITAVQTRQEILVLTDSAIYSMQYLGPPYVWSFQIMGDNISIIGPNAVTTVNNVTYWMGIDKFYMYTGRVETLPCTLRQYIYEDINLAQGFQVVSGTNEGYNEVWWHYCSISGPNGTGTIANPNTIVDRYVVFNHLERTWYYGDWLNANGVSDGRTAWLDSALRAEPMAALYGTPGGSSNGVLVYHESGVDDGAGGPNNVLPIDSYVQSSDFDIGDGHNYGLVWRLIPDLTFDGSTVNQPSADFTVRPRNNPGSNYGSSDAPTVASTQNYAGQRTYNVQQFTQIVYVRIRGRQMAFKVSSNDLGVAWQLGAPRIDVRPDGRR